MAHSRVLGQSSPRSGGRSAHRMYEFSFPYVVQRDCSIKRVEADVLLCSVTGRVFEPLGLKKRVLNQKTHLSVLRTPRYPDMVPVCFLCTHLRVRRLRFLPGLPLPAHTVGQPTTTSPSSTKYAYPPPFALADSPPPQRKQALHTLTPQCKLFIHLTPA